MASRASSALVLLALFGVAVLFLQDAQGAEAGDVIIASSNADIDVFETTPAGIDEDVEDEVEDDQLSDTVDQDMNEEELGSEDTTDEGLGEIQPYVYVPEADEVEVVADDEDQDQEQEQEAASAEARPLARILQERSSKACWKSTKKCHKFYKKPGCCKEHCVNLASDNGHCGKCTKSCDTRKGYFCQSEKCRKRPSKSACGKKNKCKGENKCCKGKCLNVEDDSQNCGKCGRKCAFGSACCEGKCKKLKTDEKNCGKCGRKCGKGDKCCTGQCVGLKQSQGNCGACGKNCGFGRRCCEGKCVSITSDESNCGRCGHKCAKHVKCQYGICGYGH